MKRGRSRAGSAAQPAAATSAPSGTQALDRAVAILREIAAASDRGRRLIDIQRLVKLSKPTTHRLLKALMRQNLVVQDEKTHAYFIGPEATILALSARKRSRRLPDLVDQDLRALAQETDDTAYLMVRSGNDTVCIHRHYGDYPIKALTGEIGARRPLGIGAGGVALLAALPDDEVDAIIAANRDRIREFPNASEKLIRRAVREARNKGYSFSDGYVLKAVRGLGLPIRDAQGRVVGAISIGAIRERVTRARIAPLVAALTRAQRTIESRLRQPGVKPLSRR